MRKTKARLAPAAALLLSIAVLLAGCWDRTEINDMAIVLASAIDKEEDLVRLSIEVPLVGQLGGAKGGGGGTGGGALFHVDSDTGVTVRDVDNKLQRRMARDLYFSHRRVIVIGEELARSGMKQVLDAIARVPENRLTSYLVISKGSGNELLRVEPKLERFSAEAIREIIKTGSLIGHSIRDTAEKIGREGVDPVLLYLEPVQSKQSNSPSSEVQAAGYAQLKDDRMIDVYTGRIAQSINWIKNDIRPYITTVPIPDSDGLYVTFRITEGSTDVKIKPTGDTVHIHVKMNGRAIVQETMNYHMLDKPSILREFEVLLNKEIQAGMNDLIERIQKNGVDPGGFGVQLSRRWPNLWKRKYREGWRETLQASDIQVDSNVRILHVGQTTENIVNPREYER